MKKYSHKNYARQITILGSKEKKEWKVYHLKTPEKHTTKL